MNDVTEVTQRVSTYFRVIMNDGDKRVVVKGLTSHRRNIFYNAIAHLAPDVQVEAAPNPRNDVCLDLSSDSQMSKYDFMDRVIIALQRSGVSIGAVSS